MKLDKLTSQAQDGLRLWAAYQHDDEMLFDAIGSSPEHWAWIWFQLRAAKDRPEWFPHGKWATLQFIQGQLDGEATGGTKS